VYQFLHISEHNMEGKKSESITRMKGTDERFVSETYVVYRGILTADVRAGTRPHTVR